MDWVVQKAVELGVMAIQPVAAERSGLKLAGDRANAFAYTETGHVAITLEPARLVIAVTGIGIKAAEIGRVFQRYYKGAASSGSGIGLSLTKRICDRYGWALAIESRQDQGTVARLEFGAAS